MYAPEIAPRVRGMNAGIAMESSEYFSFHHNAVNVRLNKVSVMCISNSSSSQSEKQKVWGNVVTY